MLAVFCPWVFQFYFSEAALGRPAYFSTVAVLSPSLSSRPPIPPMLIHGLFHRNKLSPSFTWPAPFFLSFPLESSFRQGAHRVGWDAVSQGGCLGPLIACTDCPPCQLLREARMRQREG